jgi:hypothetical protein
MSSRRRSLVPSPSAVRAQDSDAVEVLEPVAQRGGSFFTFSYTYTEVSVAGGRTRVKSKSTRVQDGKVVSQAFEGELDSGAYQQLVRQVQEQLIGQTTQWFQSLGGWLLPFARRRPDRD